MEKRVWNQAGVFFAEIKKTDGKVLCSGGWGGGSLYNQGIRICSSIFHLGSASVCGVISYFTKNLLFSISCGSSSQHYQFCESQRRHLGKLNLLASWYLIPLLRCTRVSIYTIGEQHFHSNGDTTLECHISQSSTTLRALGVVSCSADCSFV